MYPGSEMPRGMLILRVDAPMYYANVEVRGGGVRCGFWWPLPFLAPCMEGQTP